MLTWTIPKPLAFSPVRNVLLAAPLARSHGGLGLGGKSILTKPSGQDSSTDKVFTRIIQVNAANPILRQDRKRGATLIFNRVAQNFRSSDNKQLYTDVRTSLKYSYSLQCLDLATDQDFWQELDVADGEVSTMPFHPMDRVS